MQTFYRRTIRLLIEVGWLLAFSLLALFVWAVVVAGGFAPSPLDEGDDGRLD